MDPAVASIIAAVISAMASVIVALIGKSSPQKKSRSGKLEWTRIIPSKNRRVWFIVTTILLVEMVLVPVLIHWDMAVFNFIPILVLTFILASRWPVKPWSAAAVVLMLYSVNIFMEPLGWWLHGATISFSSGDTGYFLFVLGMVLVNSTGVWIMARWRSRALVNQVEEEIAASQSSPEEQATEAPSQSASISDELVKLTQLRESGALTDEEFQKAKEKLLNG